MPSTRPNLWRWFPMPPLLITVLVLVLLPNLPLASAQLSGLGIIGGGSKVPKPWPEHLAGMDERLKENSLVEVNKEEYDRLISKGPRPFQAVVLACPFRPAHPSLLKKNVVEALANMRAIARSYEAYLQQERAKHADADEVKLLSLRQLGFFLYDTSDDFTETSIMDDSVLYHHGYISTMMVIYRLPATTYDAKSIPRLIGDNVYPAQCDKRRIHGRSGPELWPECHGHTIPSILKWLRDSSKQTFEVPPAEYAAAEAEQERENGIADAAAADWVVKEAVKKEQERRKQEEAVKRQLEEEEKRKAEEAGAGECKAETECNAEE